MTGIVLFLSIVMLFLFYKMNGYQTEIAQLQQRITVCERGDKEANYGLEGQVPSIIQNNKIHTISF